VVSHRDFDAIVIGAGLNGLTTATLLGKAGLRTVVLEAMDGPGGLSATEEFAPGFRCDTGLHDPGWLSPDLARELGLADGVVEFLKPDPPLSALLPEGGALQFWRDPERTSEALGKLSAKDGKRWPEFAARMEQYAGALATLYRTAPPRAPDPSMRDLGNLLRFGLRLRGLGKNGMTEFLRWLPMSASEILDSWFEHDAVKGALGASGCFGLFQGPRSAGTGFVMLHRHVGAELGAFGARGLVKGGSGRLAAAMAKAAADQGVELRYGAAVSQVIIRSGEAVGVSVGKGDQISARVVVSGADPRTTFLSLVGESNLSPEFVHLVGNIRFRGAWAKVHLGLRDLPEFRGVESSALSGVVTATPSLVDLEKAYDDAKYGRASQRPQMEFTVPSLSDPTLAPPTNHVMSVRVQYAPYHLRNGGWNQETREALGDRVVSALSEYAPDLADLILHREVLTPRDLESRFRLTEGDSSHGELALDQILFMRPVADWANYRTPIRNLFLCGTGTHPGPGIIGGSGRLAARAVLSELKR
jgi:phytoene dehydrogenase-like protein